MSSNQVRVQKILREVFNLTPDFQDWAELEYGKSANWDSLAHMDLITRLENDFSIMLGTQDIVAMSSYDVALNILKKHGIDIGS